MAFHAWDSKIDKGLVERFGKAFAPLPPTHNSWLIQVPAEGSKITAPEIREQPAKIAIHIARYVRVPPDRYYYPADQHERGWCLPVSPDDMWCIGSWSYREEMFSSCDGISVSALQRAMRWVLKNKDKAELWPWPHSKIGIGEGQPTVAARPACSGQQLSLF